MAESGENVRATVSYSIPGSSQAQNVFHWRLGSDPTDADLLADVAEWVENVWGDEWENLAVITAELTDVKVDIVTVTGLVVRNIGIATINRFGDKIGSGLPAGVTPMIFAPTAEPKVRGRKFIPGPTEQDLAGGLWDADILAVMANLLLIYTTQYVGPNGSDLRPGVLAKSVNAFELLLAGGSFDDIPDYQRRRRPDRGT